MNVATSCKPVQTLGAISHTMPVTLTWKGRNKDHDFSVTCVNIWEAPETPHQIDQIKILAEKICERSSFKR